jgi:hypothetical protein
MRKIDGCVLQTQSLIDTFVDKAENVSETSVSSTLEMVVRKIQGQVL